MPHDSGSWFRRVHAEDPVRMRHFRSQTAQLAWDSPNATASLNALFAAVDELAQAEIEYYSRRRRTRAWVSGLTRMGAWLLGTVGLLLPLLAGAGPQTFQGLGQLGYTFLAASASCLAANTLFGGTAGHVRFVATQLELEKLMVAARVAWCKHQAMVTADTDHQAAGFDQILAYASSVHTLTIGETGRWGETLLTELGKFQRTIESRGASGSKAG